MQKVIQKYFLFQLLSSMAFFSPIVVLFWQENGLSMTQIMLLQSIYAIGVAILELPTGAFADYFGKKKSLLLGALFWVTGCFWYGTSHTFWQFVGGELLLGIGSAFFSGADRAYLHQVLTDFGKEDQFKKIEGKARGVMQLGQGIGSIVGGFIANISLNVAVFASGFANIINFWVIFSFPNTKKEERHSSGYSQIIKESLILVYQHKELLWLTLFFASFYALVWPLQFYAQLYFKQVNLPLYQYGIAYFLFSSIAAFFLQFTHFVELKCKNNIYLVLSITIVIFLIIVSLFQSIILVPLWTVYIITNFMNQTFISGRVLEIVPPQKAATILSFQSLMRRLICSAILPVLGYLSDLYSFKTTLLLYAGFAFILLTTLIVIKKKFR